MELNNSSEEVKHHSGKMKKNTHFFNDCNGLSNERIQQYTIFAILTKLMWHFRSINNAFRSRFAIRCWVLWSFSQSKFKSFNKTALPLYYYSSSYDDCLYPYLFSMDSFFLVPLLSRCFFLHFFIFIHWKFCLHRITSSISISYLIGIIHIMF